MNNIVSGINEAGIDKLVADIQDIVLKLDGHYTNIINLVEESNDMLSGDIVLDLKNYFATVKSNFKIIKSNLLSYSTDFENLKKKVKVFSEDEAVKVNKSTNNIDWR